MNTICAYGTGSTSASRACNQRSLARVPHCGQCKGGVHALTRQAAYSCGKHNYNVRVNAILPSYVWTPLVAEKAIKEFGSEESAIAALAARNLLGRLNEPDDIAWAVVFLASDESRQITGIELVIDGGQLVG